MFEQLRRAEAERLSREDYLADFYRVFDGDSGDIRRFDKLERGQSFAEPGYDSWEAFARGDWANALALIEKGRASLTSYYEDMARRGLTARRVRIVERPVTPYLQWEMHVLRLRAELGESIRVIDAASLGETEAANCPLPELVLLGDAVVYEVRYTRDGVGDGARRFTDRAVIEETAAVMDGLHARGTNVLDFFDREISHLRQPV